MTFTNEQSMLLLARAICELADGDLEGAGVAHARNLSALAARGLLPDLSSPPPPRTDPRLPSPAEALTNETIDGTTPPTPVPERRVVPGSNEWIDLQQQVEAEANNARSLGERLRGRR